jgi:hypothetical protein
MKVNAFFFEWRRSNFKIETRAGYGSAVLSVVPVLVPELVLSLVLVLLVQLTTS